MVNERVLVVEDERIVAEEIRHILTSMGYDVVGVSSTGQDAIRKAGEKAPDIVLMDIRLKGAMDGIEAAGIILERFFIPTIYLTAFADEETFRRAKLTRPLGYIVKPLDIAHVRSVIEIASYRHTREKALIESERLLSAVARNIENGIMATDNAGKITYLNPAAGMITGTSLALAAGKHLDDVVTVLDLNGHEAAPGFFGEIVAGSLPVPAKGSIIMRSADGYEIPVSYVISPLTEDSGMRSGFLMIIHDISKRLKIEKALQNGSSIYRSFIEASREGVMSVDARHSIVFVSQDLANLLGYSKDRMTGQPLFGYVSPSHIPDLHSRLGSAGESAVTSCEIGLIKSDGSDLRALLTINSMVDSDGDYTGALLLVSDISGRKALETRLSGASENTRLYLGLIDSEVRGMNDRAIGLLENAGRASCDGAESPVFRAALEKSLEALRSSSRTIDGLKKLHLEHEGRMPKDVRDIGRELACIRDRYSAGRSRVIVNYEPAGGCSVIAGPLINDMISLALDSLVVRSSGPLRIDLSVKKVEHNGREHCSISIECRGTMAALEPAGRESTGSSGLGMAEALAHCYRGEILVEDRPGGEDGERLVILLPAYQGGGHDAIESPVSLVTGPVRLR